jgi:hypothetical protein
METAAAGGRATPERGNATGFNRWLFTLETAPDSRGKVRGLSWLVSAASIRANAENQ